MKKLVLSLLCIGGVLALPSCRDCNKTCEQPCNDVCDDYYNDCGKEDYCDDREVVGYEEQQGYRKKIYRNKPMNNEVGPRRKLMYKPVNEQIIRDAEAAGKTCTPVDPRYRKENKKMYKESIGKTKRMNKNMPESMDE